MYSTKEGLSEEDEIQNIQYILEYFFTLLQPHILFKSEFGINFEEDKLVIPPGPPGIDGPKGDQGNTGGIGPQGNTGGIGPRGPKGDQGKIGIDGRDGASIFDVSKIMLNGETELDRSKKRHKNRDDDKDAPEPSTAYTTLFV
jgi:hypothetical protein